MPHVAAKAWQAALIGAVVAAAGFSVAAAEQWTSSDGRLQITVPSNWPVDLVTGPADQIQQIIVGTANNECRVYTVPNPGTQTATTQQMIAAFAQPFTPQQWNQIITGVPMVRGGTLSNPTVDASGFYPRQEAQVTTADGLVYASIQGRPGYDIYAFCKTYEGPDQPELYNTVLDSIGAAGDAAAAAAAVAPVAPTPPPAS